MKGSLNLNAPYNQRRERDRAHTRFYDDCGSNDSHCPPGGESWVTMATMKNHTSKMCAKNTRETDHGQKIFSLTGTHKPPLTATTIHWYNIPSTGRLVNSLCQITAMQTTTTCLHRVRSTIEANFNHWWARLLPRPQKNKNWPGSCYSAVQRVPVSPRKKTTGIKKPLELPCQ